MYILTRLPYIRGFVIFQKTPIMTICLCHRDVMLSFDHEKSLIVLDLLEKSRVTYQLPGIERNYHIFYFITCGAYPDYAGKILIFAFIIFITYYGPYSILE